MTQNQSSLTYKHKSNHTLLKNAIKQQRSRLFAKNAHADHAQLAHLQENNRYSKVTMKQELNNKIITNSTPLHVEHRRLFKGMKFSQKTNKISNLRISVKSRKKTEHSLEMHKNSSDHSDVSPKFQRTERFIKHSYSITQPNQNNQSHSQSKIAERRIFRTKSFQSSQILSKIQRVQRYNQQQRTRLNINLHSEENRYKNEKLNILTHQHLNIIKKLPNYLLDKTKIKLDVRSLGSLFEKMAEQEVCIARHGSHVFKTAMGLLIFYIGYELYIKFAQGNDEEHKNYQLILSNFFQIYYAMKLKAPGLILESYLTLIDQAITNQNYDHAQRYAQKCLIVAIHYNQKYYEERCVQKISMCEYYKGNVCQATYLHDNNGQLTSNSIKQLREYYNEQEQMDVLFHHLYEVPKFSLEELLKDYDERMDNYKSIVVFKSPRIGPEDSFNTKKEQLRIDLRTMERLREFKKQAEMIRKQVKRHENLFKVRSIEENQDEFKLIKRNLVINEENQSSQVLKVHQSLNRVKKVSTKSLRVKLHTQFVQFIKKIQLKFSDFGN